MATHAEIERFRDVWNAEAARTIALLEDSRYNPPASQLNYVHGDQRDRFRDDLNLPPETLQYRWARATILVTSLRAMLNGAAHPLKRAAFTPFQEDFYEGIVVAYNALKPDVQAFVADPTADIVSSSASDIRRTIR